MLDARSVTATLIYTYNADGLRMAQSANDAVTTFTWDLGAWLPSVLATSDGALELYGLALIGERRGDEWRYLLPDALGSARQASDGAGKVLLARGYRPFGTEMWRAGNSASAWGFTGEWWDVDANLLYLRARWYEPRVGRFISQDPWKGDSLRPQSLNGWAYVEGNPVRFVDPLGLRALKPWYQWYQEILECGVDIIHDLGDANDDKAQGAIDAISVNFDGGIISGPNSCADIIPYALNYYAQGWGYDYNRFDWLISGWFDYWKWRALEEGRMYVQTLDPNFVKAIVYAESRVGYGLDSSKDENQSTDNAPPRYRGVMQLGENEINSSLINEVQWGPINVVEPDDPIYNIGGGVRWLIHKYELPTGADNGAGRESWSKAFACYVGESCDESSSLVKKTVTLYQTGLDPDTYPPGDESDFYLFTPPFIP